VSRAGIVLGLECSRLARNSTDWHQLLELCGLTGTLICDEDGLYDPRNFNDRLVLGMKGQISEAELLLIKARLRGGQLSKARRGELIMPLPVGLIYDAAGRVILDPDTAIQGALKHLFTTFEATRSATAVVKAFRAAGLTFPWRHQKDDPARARSTGSRCATTRCCGCCGRAPVVSWIGRSASRPALAGGLTLATGPDRYRRRRPFSAPVPVLGCYPGRDGRACWASGHRSRRLAVPGQCSLRAGDRTGSVRRRRRERPGVAWSARRRCRTTEAWPSAAAWVARGVRRVRAVRRARRTGCARRWSSSR
jgi:hypothetical protein